MSTAQGSNVLLEGYRRGFFPGHAIGARGQRKIGRKMRRTFTPFQYAARRRSVRSDQRLARTPGRGLRRPAEGVAQVLNPEIAL